jgi:integrase
MSVENSPAVRQWLAKLAPATQRVGLSNFKGWMAWVKENGGEFGDMSPDDMVKFQQAVDNGSRYMIIDRLVQPYLTACDVRYHTKRQRLIHIRSFFSHNRAELARDPNMRIRSDKPPIQGTLTVEDVKLVILACKPAYQAAFLCMWQGAMDQEMFTFWNERGYNDLIRQLATVQKLPREEQTIRIQLPGRKSNRNKEGFYTFIGADAIDAIRNWLPGRPSHATAIFTDQQKTPLDKSNMRHLWNYHLKRLGLVPPELKHKGARTGKGLHEMRDVWRSLWSKSPASHTVGEYLMGHTIDALQYDKSYRDVEFYRREYLKAAPWFNIMSSGRPFRQVSEDEIEHLQRRIKELEAGKSSEVEELQRQLGEQQRMIELMMPTFRMAQRMFDREMKLDRLMESSKEP